MLLTTAQAATLVGVPIGTLQSWRDRGLLTPVARSAQRGYALLYREQDVLAAERRSRQADPTRRRARKLANGLAREGVSDHPG